MKPIKTIKLASGISKAHVLLKILAISSHNIRQGRIKKVETAFADIEKEIRDIK